MIAKLCNEVDNDENRPQMLSRLMLARKVRFRSEKFVLQFRRFTCKNYVVVFHVVLCLMQGKWKNIKPIVDI